MTFRQLCNLAVECEAWTTLRSMRDVASVAAKNYFAASRKHKELAYLYELGNEALADAEYANDLSRMHEPSPSNDIRQQS